MGLDKFKVIVAGGGPIGLTTAHALSRAGIDFVVPEHGVSVTTDDAGASLVLWPQGLRVLAQLGLRGRLEEIRAEMKCTKTMTADAYKYKETYALEAVKRNHGARQTVFHRAHLLRALYDSLSETDEARILTNKKVMDIAVTVLTVEVTVRCNDGSSYNGQIVIGADGVHSKVRQSMRELAVKSGTSDINEEKPYLSGYRVLWCTFPRQTGLEQGDSIESHGTDVSIQCLISHDRSRVFIYERLEKPTRDRVPYSQDDVEALAARYGGLPISETLKVKDVFSKRYMAGMANLEEGIVKHWSWNRLVLVGDACHEFTSTYGIGYKNGIQDVVVLVNELHQVMTLNRPGNSTPALGTLTDALSRYQAARMESLSWMFRLFDRYIFPSIPGFDEFMVTHVVAKEISKSFIFNFVNSKEYYQGTIPWKHVMASTT
ncbi:hypothetical protein F5B21DRAFT_516079 [Xylaria acuta]|nr:hypothetical protein F5B21DRAFT_516079 [Xylaria acuta]